MTVLPVVHSDAELRVAIRRGSPRSVRVRACRTVERLQDLFERELIEAVVVDVRGLDLSSLFALAQQYPGIPFFAFSRFRADDGPLLSRCLAEGFRGVLVQGVDDGAAGELIAARSATRRRMDELADAPRQLRLTEPLQLRAWHEVIARVGTPTRTSDIAAAVKTTREHLSREFAAGGAPNLKRVIDLVHAAWAADLLANPGYNVRTVARVLGFSTPSHLAGSARRVAGVTPGQLAELGPRGVLRRFRRGRTRSRL